MDVQGGRLQTGLCHHLAAARRARQGDHRFRRRRIWCSRFAAGVRYQHRQAALADLYDSSPDEPGGDTWKGDTAQHGGGAAWLVGSYDPKSDTVYWGTSNPGPWNTAVRSTGDGNFGKLTNLYTASMLALDPNTGKIKRHIQTTPADAWDYDGVNEAALADFKIGGNTVPALMKADRNGYFFVANRETARRCRRRSTCSPTGPRSGTSPRCARSRIRRRPGRAILPRTSARPDRRQELEPMSFNPQTGLVYIRPTMSSWTGRRRCRLQARRSISAPDFRQGRPRRFPR